VEAPSTEPTQKQSILKRLGPTFFKLNSIEMFERLAYFGIRSVIPLYIMQADDPGGLHLTAADKGTIYAWWFIFQSLLPTFTGGFADRYGYKKTMAFAISLNAIGYVMIAFMRSYFGLFAGIIVLATGTAFFKPSIQGSLAQNLTKDISSVGWGVFYWVVNIGGATAPFLASAVLGHPHSPESWRNLFLLSAGFTCFNLLLLLTFKDVPSGASKTDNVWQVLKRTLRNIVEPRLVAWLLIMSCFWLMMYQVWDLHPNFLTDWVDSSAIAGALGNLPGGSFFGRETDRGLMVPQEMLVATNAMFIILLMIPISWAVRKMRTLSAMAIGMLVATCGVLVAGLTHNGWIFLLGILFFSLGEMLTGPKKNEYLGLIAPPGKKGLYLGYVNIPIGIGGYLGSKMAGFVYGNWGEKAVLAQKYLATEAPGSITIEWDGRLSTLEAAVGVARPDAFVRLMEVTNLDAVQATQLLWDTYDPQYWVWFPFAAIGVVATIVLVIFGQMAKRWADMDA
jgi:MFS family permease